MEDFGLLACPSVYNIFSTLFLNLFMIFKSVYTLSLSTQRSTFKEMSESDVTTLSMVFIAHSSVFCYQRVLFITQENFSAKFLKTLISFKVCWLLLSHSYDTYSFADLLLFFCIYLFSYLNVLSLPILHVVHLHHS